MTRDSLCRVASVTRPTPAAATTMPVERGVFELECAVDASLPELSVPVVLNNPGGPLNESEVFGALVARAAGTTLGEDLLETMFEPLTMPDAGFLTDQVGGLVSSADDWLAFGRMLLEGGGQVLGPDSAALTMTDPVEAEPDNPFLDGGALTYAATGG